MGVCRPWWKMTTCGAFGTSKKLWTLSIGVCCDESSWPYDGDSGDDGPSPRTSTRGDVRNGGCDALD